MNTPSVVPETSAVQNTDSSALIFIILLASAVIAVCLALYAVQKK